MEFQDDDEFEAWLKTQPQEICVMIATRAAMRVWWAIAWMPDGSSLTDEHRRLALLTGHAMLISGVAAVSPTPEIKKVAASASASASSSSARSSAAYDPSRHDFAADYAAHSSDYAASAAYAAAASAASGSSYVRSSAAASSAAFVAYARPSTRSDIAAAARSSAARSSAYEDAGQSVEILRSRSLWGDKHPDFLSDILKRSRPLSVHDADFDFWIRWYEAADRGEPLDFDLQYRIATEIPDEIWTGEDAPRRVAKEIARIEAEWEAGRQKERPDSVPELERETLMQRVKELLRSPEMTVNGAEATADMIASAIQEYKAKAQVNQLPEELEHLENVPEHFRAIARIVQSGQALEAKEEQLVQRIEALNEEIAALETDLREAQKKTLNWRFKVQAIEALGKTVGSLPFWASLGYSTCHFFGILPSDLTLENFRQWISDVPTAIPSDGGVGDLRPPFHDI